MTPQAAIVISITIGCVVGMAIIYRQHWREQGRPIGRWIVIGVVVLFALWEYTHLYTRSYAISLC